MQDQTASDELGSEGEGPVRRHLSEVVAAALSPDGRYLATGSNFSRSYSDGHLLIWDVAAAQLLHVHTIPGGVSWPDHFHLLRWRPDGRRLGLAFDTNAVGVLDPFADQTAIVPTLYVTDGWPSPPDWQWSPDGTQLYIACWGRRHELGAFVSSEPDSPTPRWAQRVPFTLDEDGDENEPALEPLSELRWQVPGLLTGWGGSSTLVGLDPSTGAILWTKEVRHPALWQSDGTPDEAGWSPPPSYSQLIASPQGQRIAALLPREYAYSEPPGVHLLEGGERRGVLPAQLGELALRRGPRFAWSPCGQRGALLRENGVLELWDLATTPRRLSELSIDGATGVFYGPRPVVVGPQLVAFVQDDGTLHSLHPQGSGE
jgi:hypothetical protein